MKRRLLVAAASLAAIGLLVWLGSVPRPKVARASLEDDPLRFGASHVHGARPLPPLEEMRFSEGAPGLGFFAIGDTGWAGVVLASNTAAMERTAESQRTDFVLLLGDNFYPAGVVSTEDSLWRERFEDVFPGPKLAIPFYAVLGNHDHRGNAEAQVAHTQASSRWRMPARWYTFTEKIAGGGEAQFFALDTQAIENDWNEASAEEEWLAGELAHSKARWKIVFGHQPLISNGAHGATLHLAAVVAPICEKHGVDLYVSGHDHDLQLLHSHAGWLQIVSGAGCSTRDTSWGADTLFAAATPGFVWVGIGAKELWIEMSTGSSGPQFRWKVAKP